MRKPLWITRRWCLCTRRAKASFSSFSCDHPKNLQVKDFLRPYTAAAGSGVAASVVVTRFAMVRSACAIDLTNNQTETIATPTNEIHIIHSATVTLVLLVKALAKPARYGWLADSTAKTSGP